MAVSETMRPVFSGEQIAGWCKAAGITHFVWVPDSELGLWESALRAESTLHLIQVCREGEAMGIAAGLMLAGKRPVVACQSTGFFEAGDAFRNAVYDLCLPLFLLIGYRSYFAYQAGTRKDSAARFIEPILRAWELSYQLFLPGAGIEQLNDFYTSTARAGKAGAALIAETRL